MQTLHQAHEAAEIYSPAEEAFNRRRRTVGLFLAPALFAAALLLPLPLTPSAQRMAAVLLCVVVLWMTEAIPLAATALVGPTLAVLLQLAPARQAYAPFADPIIFLVIGGFMLAQAMFVHGLDRRIAYRALALAAVGSSPMRMLVVYGAVCTCVSMWVSNTATTAMMFPIGLSIIAHLSRARPASAAQVRRFALAMMLMTAFGASVGGIATPVGTGTNLIGIGLLRRIGGADVTFAQWVALGLPIAGVLFAILAAQLYVSGARGMTLVAEGAQFVREELAHLGPATRGQRNVLVAFGVAVTLWAMPGVLAVTGLTGSALGQWYGAAVPESVAAVVGATLLFVLPIDWRARRFTLTWEEAARIDWAVVLLFGGGLAMGELVFQTGLAKAIGEGLTSWLPAQTTVSLTIVFTAAAILLSETASNTASANMIVPIAIAVAQAAGVRALEPALGATLGASMGFMMPISTPPNAIVYSSGYVPIGQMMRHGLLLDVLGFVVIVAMVLGLAPIIF